MTLRRPYLMRYGRFFILSPRIAPQLVSAPLAFLGGCFRPRTLVKKLTALTYTCSIRTPRKAKVSGRLSSVALTSYISCFTDQVCSG